LCVVCAGRFLSTVQACRAWYYVVALWKSLVLPAISAVGSHDPLLLLFLFFWIEQSEDGKRVDDGWCWASKMASP
jgi:hypothetical protein